jgi:hypothetical protein
MISTPLIGITHEKATKGFLLIAYPSILISLTLGPPARLLRIRSGRGITQGSR